MPNLKCSVKSCNNNETGMCYLESIDVSGGSSKANTCCSSFDSTSTSRNHSKGASPESSIYCRAMDCTHNDDSSCTANSVDICSCGQACHCHDTACSTFEKSSN